MNLAFQFLSLLFTYIVISYSQYAMMRIHLLLHKINKIIEKHVTRK